LSTEGTNSTTSSSWQEWLSARSRFERKDYHDFTKRFLWSPAPLYLQSLSLDEKITVALQQLRSTSIQANRPVFEKIQTVLTFLTSPSSTASRRHRTPRKDYNLLPEKVDALLQQVRDAIRNHQDVFALLSAHAVWLGSDRWRMEDLEFSCPFPSPPTLLSPPIVPMLPTSSLSSTNLRSTEWMFLEFAGFMSCILPDTPLARAFTQFSHHESWRKAWSSPTFQRLPVRFFETHYRAVLQPPLEPAQQREAWFVWLLILYFAVFYSSETRPLLFPLLASSGYPYHHDHPEQLLREKDLPTLVQGFFAPYQVKVPTRADIQQSFLLETLWLLLHTNEVQEKPVPDKKTTIDAEPQMIDFVSLQDSVHNIQKTLARTYLHLLQTKWMNPYEWEKFQQWDATNLDVAERVIRFLESRGGSWPRPWRQVWTQFLSLYTNQQISYGQCGLYVKRHLRSLCPSAREEEWTQFWTHRQAEMDGWLHDWTPSLPLHGSLVQSGPSLSWWKDLSSPFAYSWNGGTQDIVCKLTTRYLKSMFVVSAASFAASTHTLSSTSSFE
jgi:hypothetical protein